ncbi:MAG: FAD-dependent oxidoreductase [bacterium]
MKVLIVGGVAGGASTAARLRRLDEQAEIIMFERGNHISFANCGIPYYCGDVIQERAKLELMTPQKIKGLLNIDARVRSEVIKIDRATKTLTILDKKTNTQYEETYDKLVLSPGAAPIKPPIEGINDERILTVRNLDDADKIKKLVSESNVKNVAVIGAGYIGLEMAENLTHIGINVSIIELSNQVLAPVDYEIAAHLHNHLRDNGVELYITDGVKSFTSSEKLIVNLNSEKQLEVDFVILAIGVKPETKLAVDAGLELGKTGGILVDEHLQTSDFDIFAVGDVIEVKDLVSQTPALIPLAGPANRQGRIVADNICGLNSQYKATQGTAILKLFDMAVAMTGNNEKGLTRNNIPYLKTYVHGASHAEYYPEAFPLTIKLLFSPIDGKILGAQAIGMEGIDKRIDVIATAMRFGKTVSDLVGLELSYAPPFGSAKDPVNISGMVAENILVDNVKVIYWDEIEELSKDSFVLDVRTPTERSIGKFEGSYNIPIEELRNRINEVPKDKKVIVYCAKGLKSYFASRILMQNGYENVYSLSGGYLLYKQVLWDKTKRPQKAIVCKNEKPDISKSIKIDACGMQCPGPIMKLADTIKDLQNGEIVEIKTTDSGFKMDIISWCNSTGNECLCVETENKIIKAYIKKGASAGMNNVNNEIVKNNNGQTIVVFSNDLDKAIASLIIANAAAAAGKQTTMFFTFWGINILRKSKSVKVKKGLIDKMFGLMMPKGPDKLALSKMHMLGMGSEMMKYVMKSKNVPSLTELIQMAQNNGIKIIACTMAMDVMGLKPEELIDGIEFGGAATYIDESSKAGSNLFI